MALRPIDFRVDRPPVDPITQAFAAALTTLAGEAIRAPFEKAAERRAEVRRTAQQEWELSHAGERARNVARGELEARAAMMPALSEADIAAKIQHGEYVEFDEPTQQLYHEASHNLPAFAMYQGRRYVSAEERAKIAEGQQPASGYEATMELPLLERVRRLQGGRLAILPANVAREPEGMEGTGLALTRPMTKAEAAEFRAGQEGVERFVLGEEQLNMENRRLLQQASAAEKAQYASLFAFSNDDLQAMSGLTIGGKLLNADEQQAYVHGGIIDYLIANHKTIPAGYEAARTRIKQAIANGQLLPIFGGNLPKEPRDWERLDQQWMNLGTAEVARLRVPLTWMRNIGLIPKSIDLGVGNQPSPAAMAYWRMHPELRQAWEAYGMLANADAYHQALSGHALYDASPDAKGLLEYMFHARGVPYELMGSRQPNVEGLQPLPRNQQRTGAAGNLTGQESSQVAAAAVQGQAGAGAAGEPGTGRMRPAGEVGPAVSGFDPNAYDLFHRDVTSRLRVRAGSVNADTTANPVYHKLLAVPEDLSTPQRAAAWADRVLPETSVLRRALHDPRMQKQAYDALLRQREAAVRQGWSDVKSNFGPGTEGHF